MLLTCESDNRHPVSELSISELKTVIDIIDICTKHRHSKRYRKYSKRDTTITSQVKFRNRKKHTNKQNMGDFVHLNISNSQNDVVCFEKKFPKDITIADLKVIMNAHHAPETRYNATRPMTICINCVC